MLAIEFYLFLILIIFYLRELDKTMQACYSKFKNCKNFLYFLFSKKVSIISDTSVS